MNEREPLDSASCETGDDAGAQGASIAAGEIVLGTFVALDDECRPLVNFSENASAKPLLALSTVALTRSQLGRPVALLFTNGDITKPVVIGLIHSPLYAILENSSGGVEKTANDQEAPVDASFRGATSDASGDAEAQPATVSVDGERVVIEGRKEVVLRCGDASITLTQAGKILVRGKYLLSRSSGVNRILGGSVQVN